MASGTEHRTELPSRKADLYSTPIPSRPPRTARDWLRLALFNLSFLVLLLWSHLPQLLAFPLSWIPHLWPRAIFEACNVHSKETFASSLVFIVSQFAPTTIVLTAADESIRLDELLQRDEHGEVVGFKLARRALWMSNHQVRLPEPHAVCRTEVLIHISFARIQMYCDWIYPWCLMSFAGVSSGIIILLKASLKWAPLVGPVSPPESRQKLRRLSPVMTLPPSPACRRCKCSGSASSRKAGRCTSRTYSRRPSRSRPATSRTSAWSSRKGPSIPS